MKWLPNVINRLLPAKEIESRVNVTDQSWFQVINGIKGTDKIAAVTPRTAMSINAVFACVNLITETSTLVQPKIWRYGIDGKKQVVDHDQIPLLTREANYYTSSIEWDKIWTAMIIKRWSRLRIRSSARLTAQ